ncbi:general secretion pathway protein H [Candidatus Photodesmus katoptron]|uniref:Prepilin-type N-terminal cleavage/methylation protein n=1 Tax=Candidatus Photodesmus katoptron Akat1 TaxID=1236703 RepID=S3DII3_9GAMM|nr:type II secretion system protein [Candidatus Photodesmus katoptron]EPE37530.1 prepilin-type N-terminal cleavage/methylation protein [Candidatus Photodesmus katoptron Akat1]KEY90180.1 general secretion pathway protein H [Candidatus Photodesmus katoptron]
MKLSRGFTLFEILIVLVLLSISAITVVNTFYKDSNQNLVKKYTTKLFNEILFLNEQAILTGKNFGVFFDKKELSYALMFLNQQVWQPIKFHKIQSKTKLNKNKIRIRLTINNNTRGNNEKHFFSTKTLSDRNLLFASKSQHNQSPQIVFYSNGEVTPSSILISSKHKKQERWSIIIKKNGQILLLELKNSEYD